MKNIVILFLLLTVHISLVGKKQGMPLADSLAIILASPNSKEDTNKVKLLGQLVNCTYGNRNKEMMQYAEQELKLAERLNYQDGIAKGYYDVGLAWYELNNQVEALKNFVKALEINQTIKNKTGIATCSNRIGWAYYLQSDFPTALQNYIVAEKIFEETDDN